MPIEWLKPWSGDCAQVSVLCACVWNGGHSVPSPTQPPSLYPVPLTSFKLPHPTGPLTPIISLTSLGPLSPMQALLIATHCNGSTSFAHSLMTLPLYTRPTIDFALLLPKLLHLRNLYSSLRNTNEVCVPCTVCHRFYCRLLTLSPHNDMSTSVSELWIILAGAIYQLCYQTALCVARKSPHPSLPWPVPVVSSCRSLSWSAPCLTATDEPDLVHKPYEESCPIRFLFG